MSTTEKRRRKAEQEGLSERSRDELGIRPNWQVYAIALAIVVCCFFFLFGALYTASQLSESISQAL